MTNSDEDFRLTRVNFLKHISSYPVVPRRKVLNSLSIASLTHAALVIWWCALKQPSLTGHRILDLENINDHLTEYFLGVVG